MANNFSIFYDPTSTDSTELPLFKEYLIDYENQGKQPIYNGREITILTGNDAVKIWIYRALKTERLTYAIHSDSYGNDLKEHIGTVYKKQLSIFSNIYSLTV